MLYTKLELLKDNIPVIPQYGFDETEIRRIIKLEIKEGLTWEFKHGLYDFSNKTSKHYYEFIKIVASMANSAGGYIIVGVEDKTGKLNEINSNIKDYFSDSEKIGHLINSPLNGFNKNINVGSKIITIDDVNIGVLFIEQAVNYPVIFTKTIKTPKGMIQSGSIFVRKNTYKDIASPEDIQKMFYNVKINEQQSESNKIHLYNLKKDRLQEIKIEFLTNKTIESEFIYNMESFDYFDAVTKNEILRIKVLKPLWNSLFNECISYSSNSEKVINKFLFRSKAYSVKDEKTGMIFILRIEYSNKNFIVLESCLGKNDFIVNEIIPIKNYSVDDIDDFENKKIKECFSDNNLSLDLDSKFDKSLIRKCSIKDYSES